MAEIMGISIPMSYVFENNMLTLTVSAFGVSKTETEYAEVIGDVLYTVDTDGTPIALSRIS